MIKTELLDHQNKAFTKLKDLKVGALFMDMGTGKTRTVFEFIEYRKKKINHIIWFCPLAVKKTIADEIKKHTDYSFQILESQSQIEHNKNIYIVGIQSIISDKLFFTLNNFVTENDYIICDESLFIKTHTAKRTKRIIQIGHKGRYRTILNGTPISCNEADLFMQMYFLSPLIFGFSSYYTFAANHLIYSEKYPGKIEHVLNPEQLAYKMNPYVYQVKKEECLDLPGKVYSSRYYVMNEDQKEQYINIKHYYLSRLDECDYDYEHWFFRMFNYLQQVICGFTKIKTNGDSARKREKQYNYFNDNLSQKERILIDTIEKRTIIFCKYIYEIERISKILTKEGFTVFQYYGKTKCNLKDFEEDKESILIGNSKCMGYGLNLAFCDTIIFYSSTFNYGERMQAEDRIYRIGQKNKVLIINFICENSIDEYIHNNLNNKEQTLNSLVKEIKKVKNKKMMKKRLEEIIDGKGSNTILSRK